MINLMVQVHYFRSSTCLANVSRVLLYICRVWMQVCISTFFLFFTFFWVKIWQEKTSIVSIQTCRKFEHLLFFVGMPYNHLTKENMQFIEREKQEQNSSNFTSASIFKASVKLCLFIFSIKRDLCSNKRHADATVIVCGGIQHRLTNYGMILEIH